MTKAKCMIAEQVVFHIVCHPCLSFVDTALRCRHDERHSKNLLPGKA